MKTLCVSLASIGQMGESPSDMTPPEPGDMVTFEGQGKVSRVEGDMAYVDVETVNGDPLPEGDMMEKPEMNEEESMAQEEADLNRLASQSDEEEP